MPTPDSARHLTYRDAVLLAPVVRDWTGTRFIVEGRHGCTVRGCDAVYVRALDGGWCDVLSAKSLKRPNAAARRLLDALR